MHTEFHLSERPSKPGEFYPTPACFTEALLDAVPVPNAIWEPAVGDGAMADVLKAAGRTVVGTDLLTGHDFFLTPQPLNTEAIVTNPPYSLIVPWVRRSLLLVDWVALLLPLYALGGQQRASAVWHATPPSMCLVVPWRMRLADGVSHFNHMWVVWDRSASGPTQIQWAKESNV